MINQPKPYQNKGIKMLTNEQLALAIYNGDFDRAKDSLKEISTKVASLSCVCFDITHVTNQRQEYGKQLIDFLPLVFLGEGDHPKNFSKYRPFLDYIIQHDGLEKVLSRINRGPCVNNLLLWRMDIEKFEVPVSKNMRVYLHKQEVRNAPENKLVREILSDLNKNTRTGFNALGLTDPKQQAEVRKLVRTSILKTLKGTTIRH